MTVYEQTPRDKIQQVMSAHVYGHGEAGCQLRQRDAEGGVMTWRKVTRHENRRREIRDVTNVGTVVLIS